MTYEYCCVLDSEGYYKDLVLILLEQQEDGTVEPKIQYYSLLPGETLINADVPTTRTSADTDGCIKPRWHNKKWVEGATPEEITEWEREHPAPPPPEPSPVDVLGAQVAQLTIDNIQKDQIIDAMGAQLAQTSLDVMTMKGGA